MNLGPLSITRRRRGPAGNWQLPLETLQAEDLSPMVRAVIARVARSAAKDYLAELAESENPS